MRKLDWNKIIHDTYVELYKNSEPKADFDELVKNAEVNCYGQKCIAFNDYEIEQTKLDEIVQSFINKYKLTRWNAEQFNTTIYLGCSPKTKTND